MNVIATAIPDIMIIEPQVIQDERGFFMESYNQQGFEQAVGMSVCFVQDNHSHSARGVLRGLHYQLDERAQAKLVRAIAGAVFDVAVDMRRSSPTFGRWVGVELSAANKRQLWIPPGFAHGFVVLGECADLLYKTTDYYSPAHERCLIWNDSDLAIAWPLGESLPILSAKDLKGKSLRDADLFA